MCFAASLGSAWQGWEHGGKGGRGQTAPRSHELCCTSPFPSPHLAGGRKKREGGRMEKGRERRRVEERVGRGGRRGKVKREDAKRKEE